MTSSIKNSTFCGILYYVATGNKTKAASKSIISQQSLDVKLTCFIINSDF